MVCDKGDHSSTFSLLPPPPLLGTNDSNDQANDKKIQTGVMISTVVFAVLIWLAVLFVAAIRLAVVANAVVG